MLPTVVCEVNLRCVDVAGADTFVMCLAAVLLQILQESLAGKPAEAKDKPAPLS